MDRCHCSEAHSDSRWPGEVERGATATSSTNATGWLSAWFRSWECGCRTGRRGAAAWAASLLVCRAGGAPAGPKLPAQLRAPPEHHDDRGPPSHGAAFLCLNVSWNNVYISWESCVYFVRILSLFTLTGAYPDTRAHAGARLERLPPRAARSTAASDLLWKERRSRTSGGQGACGVALVEGLTGR